MKYFISRCSSILVTEYFAVVKATKSDFCEHFTKILHNMPPYCAINVFMKFHKMILFLHC